MSFNLKFFLQNLYFINHAFIKIEIFYAFKEAKKNLSISTAMFKDFSLGIEDTSNTCIF